MRTLTREEAKAFYDTFGVKQDQQSFYEERALQALVDNAACQVASFVFELGCGTGRFAQGLLDRHLPATARYLGVDISQTMVDLAAGRLAPFAPRARVALASGEPALSLPDASIDRFVSTYVFDLLPVEEQRRWLTEARRVLRPGGLLCLVGITPGVTPLSRTIMGLWQWLFARNPKWVGGCRPTSATERLEADEWEIRFRKVVVAWGVASEVIIAAPKQRGAGAGP